MDDSNINNNIFSNLTELSNEINQIQIQTQTHIETNTNEDLEKNPTLNVNVNVDSDSESDWDEYVDLSLKFQSESEDIYQFTVNNDKLELKNVGKFTKTPDIIIKEKFGPESNMNLYSCVYALHELMIETDELFFPLVKLVIESKTNVIITCIAIKLNQHIQIDKLFNNENQIDKWELYWLENKSDSEHIKTLKIEKNIDSTNIIEKLIDFTVNN
jgi:hypothetical protein